MLALDRRARLDGAALDRHPGARASRRSRFTGSQSGILTNDRHFDARIIEVRPHRIEDELARGKIVIVAGYQGMSYRREITTLGRGGSDTTAVALAAALGAERCEIYSDVDGVYSADPRVVPDARHLPELVRTRCSRRWPSAAPRCSTRRPSSGRGTRGIAIYARATTSAAGGDGQETRVGGEVVRERRGAVAVTGTRRITIVSGDVLSIVEGEGIALRHAGPRGVRFVHDDVPDWPRVEKRLRDAGAAIEERGEVTVVGAGVGSDAATVRRALAAAGQVHDWDASPLRLTLTVDAGAHRRGHARAARRVDAQTQTRI